MRGIEILEKIKSKPLPGEEAHALFSPAYRPKFDMDLVLKKIPKLAAVNVMLCMQNDEWHIPLILRTDHPNDKHSGQISLPGGRYEEEDANYEITAARETEEEIGIEQSAIRFIRALSPIYIPPSNFLVYPFLSFTKKNPDFFIQEMEAQKLILLPLQTLIQLPIPAPTKIFPTSRGVKVPYFTFDGYDIWGATSMILAECRELFLYL